MRAHRSLVLQHKASLIKEATHPHWIFDHPQPAPLPKHGRVLLPSGDLKRSLLSRTSSPLSLLHSFLVPRACTEEYRIFQSPSAASASRNRLMPAAIFASLHAFLASLLKSRRLLILFEISQYRDYQLAPDDLTRRMIIKQAINTRSYMGTVYMVKQAMIAVGFDTTTLVERCNEATDPVHGWAQFKILISGGFTPIDGTPGLDVETLILQYKNVRSQFLGIEYDIDPIEESFPAGTEEWTMAVDMIPIVDLYNTAGLKFDGTWLLDGTHLCRPGVETFGLTIVP